MRRAPASALLAVTAVMGLALTACGGDGQAAAPAPSPAATQSTSTASAPSPTATATTYLPVPAGVSLTDQGSSLGLTAPATVAWTPRQGVVGVLDITVTRLERTSLRRSFVGWQIPERTQSATPYFVRATVTNRGEGDLSAPTLPLYAADSAGALVESTTFDGAFRPCRDGTLPDPLAAGATAELCLVYFVPEGHQLTGVSFRPGEEFNPITWTGAIERAKRVGAGRGKNGGGATDDGSGNGDGGDASG